VASGIRGTFQRTFKYLVETPTGKTTTVILTGEGMGWLVDQRGYKIIRVLGISNPGGASV